MSISSGIFEPGLLGVMRESSAYDTNKYSCGSG